MKWKDACDAVHKKNPHSILSKEMYCYGGKDKTLMRRLCHQARKMAHKTKEQYLLEEL